MHDVEPQDESLRGPRDTGADAPRPAMREEGHRARDGGRARRSHGRHERGPKRLADRNARRLSALHGRLPGSIPARPIETITSRPIATIVSRISLCLLVAVQIAGCASREAATTPIVERPAPRYDAPLPDGARSLRLVTDPAVMPDLAAAWRERDVHLRRSLQASLRWFEAPSSRTHFPFDGFTHEQARASVAELARLVDEASSGEDFARRVRERFDVWQSVGWNGRGTVLFTGYYAPELPASRVRTPRFAHPLHRRPRDLVTDETTGTPQGRRLPDGRLVPYWTRGEIEDGNLLSGLEIAWLESPLDAFLVHVNGSARLRLRDGSVMHLGYAGKTDRPYASLGQAMIREGIYDGVGGIPAIRRAYAAQPTTVERLMRENESYVFFSEYPGDRWPAGSLGVKVHARASLATDKSVYPRGGPVLVDTRQRTFTGRTEPFVRLMLDQDTGGAIRAPGRADLYMGEGEANGILAGTQAEEGRLFYLFVKPALVQDALERAGIAQPSPNAAARSSTRRETSGSMARIGG